MNLIDAIYHRRAVRDFLDRPVSEETLRFLIGAAIQAPNALNRQAWSFVVVTNRALLESCSDQAKAYDLAHLPSNPHLAGLRERLASKEFNIFYNAPALIVICATETDAMAQQDCCLAAENLMLAAFGQGVGSCWIGLAQGWLNEQEGRDALMIPPGHSAVAPIILGYPHGTPEPVPRRDAHIVWIVEER